MKYTHLLMVLILFGLPGCKSEKQQSKTAQQSPSSLDWTGSYCGILPCADCAGIRTVLRLKQDLTYDLSQEYLGKEGQAILQSGSFQWSEQGNSISLMPWEKEGLADENRTLTETKVQYKVEEGSLRQLDLKGQVIEGKLAPNHVLLKSNVDKELREKYWKLIELRGKAVNMAVPLSEPHMILKIAENRVLGHSSCNAFSGTYTLSPDGRLGFSMLVITRMACMENTIEGEFMKALELADHYQLKNDTLSLTKARMAPLAKFVAVYFR